MTDPQPRVVHLRTHRPYIAPETLGRLNGDDEAIAAIKARLDGPARHVTCPDKPTWLSELRDDFRDTLSEIKASPYSHALVAVLTVIGWTLLLVAPMLIGAGQ